MTRKWTTLEQFRPAFIRLITPLLAVVFAFAFAGTASAACYNYPCYGPTDAVAHRGDVQYYPQLSFNGIKSAIDKGADWVEIDVHWNEPSQRLILIHDNFCDFYDVETTSVSTLEQCMGQPIVYLDDLLNYWTPRGFNRWMIELKAGCSNPKLGLTCDESSYYANRATLDLYLNLNLHALHDKVWVASIDNFMLKDIRALRYGSRYPRLMKIRPLDVSWWNNVSSGYMNDVKAMGFQAVSVDIRSTSPNSVVYAHSIGLLFASWAPGSYEPENEKAVYDIDADFHVTDRLNHLLSITSGSSGGGGSLPGDCGPYAKTCG
jgi:glycerophosphoryl diester phosphodiesterase